MLRFVEDYKEQTFEVIEELLMDKTIKFHMLAGKLPVLERVREELTNYWEGEAKKGRSIEEVARYVHESLLASLFSIVSEMNFCKCCSK